MTRALTPTFIAEIPLIVDSSQELYNALLNEAMVRMELVRDSELYKQAKKLPKGKDRDKAFTPARKAYRYSDYDLQAYATIVSNSAKWIADKIDSNTQQKLATRAFKASVKVLFGRAKRVRYKVPTRFRSVEGKTNKQGIRWKEDSVIWGKLKLQGIIDPANLVVQHGLNSPIKYVRLLWRELNGKRRWYAQLICEGLPYQKPQNYVSDGVVGLDLNISNLAFVADNGAGLLPFAQGVPTYEREIQSLQRKMQRSRRANNSDNYQPNFTAKNGRKTVTKKGKPKKGRRKWNKSKTYIKTAAKKRELERRKTAYAKSQNRKIVNDILRHGNQIKTENVSVKGWQKRYGKAISALSPSFVQSELKRKAESAGGSFVKFSCQKTALSQTHLTGERIKKSLSERVHYDKSGILMHRDLFSAYLARFVNQDELLLQDAVNQYPGSEPILVEAWKQYRQSARLVGESEILRSDSPVEQISQKLGTVNQISQFGLKVNFDSQPESAVFAHGGVAQ
nr:hypothetical protein [Hydrococcus sp. Prado102]